MKEKEIDGILFSVAPFQAMEALKLKRELFEKLGPAFGQALGLLKNGITDVGEIELNGEAAARTIEKLISKLDEETFIGLIRRLLRNVTASMTVEGKQVKRSFAANTFDASLDVVFSGRLFTIYPVILLVLEANYPDFFGKMGGIGSKIRQMATSVQPVPASENGSTGLAM